MSHLTWLTQYVICRVNVYEHTETIKQFITQKCINHTVKLLYYGIK